MKLTHGFDDEGRQFDEKGNLKSWWTKKMKRIYKESTGNGEAIQ